MKANKTFTHGAIYYVYDMSDGIYNRSYMGVAHDDTDFPELDEELCERAVNLEALFYAIENKYTDLDVNMPYNADN
jgi:hypothetical protein